MLAPRIENFKKRYEIGEVINLRCVSTQHKPMPTLHWLLDGVPVDEQYLDRKPSDYQINGFVRLDLKYRLNYHQPGSRTRFGHSQRNRTIETYHFECVQVLSDVISVAAEVAELYNFHEEQTMQGNSVEAGN